MANKNAESAQTQVQAQQQQQQQQQQQPQQQQAQEQQLEQQHVGEACGLPQPQSGAARGGNSVFKSGPLFISSKGIGWTSWKKRWFILTRTSLVFFRSDPSAVPQKGSEVNLTLGGIDLNNSGSVVVKADKKLLTVLFPDGRDGRAFTLKAETNEDLAEWKTALENALSQAPSASHVMGQNGIFRNDHAEAANGTDEKKDEKQARPAVIGRPVLLALEDVDGAPSFLEKALRFVEEHGVKVEGILRQAADVDDVEHRVREYEQGKVEFSPGEDAHVIADCVKYFLRELPSSPVPASCCNALLESCRTDRGNRVNAMRAAICESFPEPNRRLLQRILMMMQIVASNKNVNRMNTNAVAACMAPLLLRPLLAGDCEIENDFDVGGDGSMQLLQAAAAANHAQAIVITLLEEYESIFGEGSLSPDLYSDSDESGSGTEEGSDDEEYDDDDDGDGDYDASQGSYEYTDDDDDGDGESAASGDNDDDSDPEDHKAHDHVSSESKTPKASRERSITKKLSSSSRRSSLPRQQQDDARKNENIMAKGVDSITEVTASKVPTNEDRNLSTSDMVSVIQKSSTLSSALIGGSKRHWGRTGGRKNLSMESIDFAADDDEADIERLQSTKLDLQNRITEEVKNNAVLQASLERRKKALYGRRQALEKDVERLEEQLKQQRDKKAALEAGIKGNQPIPETTDEKLRKDLQDVAQVEADVATLESKVDDLENKLGHNDVKGATCKLPDRSAKMKDKQIDTEAAATHVSERSTSLKDTTRENEMEKQQDQSTLRSKSSNEVSSRGSTSKQTSLPKKSGTKAEGTASATSALSKLSMRLNFLKERRSQIANELSNMDRGRNSGHFNSPVISQTSQVSDTTQSSTHDTERVTTQQDSETTQVQVQGQNQVQNQSTLDRGRSENSVSYNGGDRNGRGNGNNHPNTTSRTFSR